MSAIVCANLYIWFYTSGLGNGVFISLWKIVNLVPIHNKKKKKIKQLLKNYRPVSLLPICGKIFERLIYNRCFTKSIPGFTKSILSITHEIYDSFDERFEVRGVFLNISKAFDKVWHGSLIFKLPRNGILGKMLLVLRGIPETESGSIRLTIVLERCNCRCSPRFNIGTSSFLYKSIIYLKVLSLIRNFLLMILP